MNQANFVQVVQRLQQLVDNVLAVDLLKDACSDDRMQIRFCFEPTQRDEMDDP